MTLGPILRSELDATNHPPFIVSALETIPRVTGVEMQDTKMLHRYLGIS